MTRLIPTRWFGLAKFGFRVFSCVFASYLSASVIPVCAAEQKSVVAAAPKASSPETSAIALADIAARATEASNLVSGLTAAAAPSPQIETIANSLPELSKKLDEYLAETKATLEAQPTLEALQTLQQEWQRDQTEGTARLSALTQQATKLQDGMNQLDDLEKTWLATRKSAESTTAPGPILQQIDATLSAITAAQAKLQTERTAMLDLQSRVAQEVTKCTTVLAQIDQLQRKAVAGIFAPDAAPIWRVESWPDAVNALPQHVRKVSKARWADFIKYVREPREASGRHATLFIVLLLLFFAARRKIGQWTKSGSSVSSVLLVFERPFSAALAVTLLIATSPFSQISTPVRQLLSVAAIVPFLRVARPVVSSSVAALSYAVCLLFALDIMRQSYSGIQVVGQAILIVETLGAIIVLFRMRRHYRQIIVERAESSRLIILKSARIILITTLIIALLAGAAGYLRLARLLAPGIFVGGVLGLGAYATLQVFGAVVAVAFRVWPLRLLQMVEHHREFLARRAYILLVWLSFLAWLARYLSYLGLLDPVWALGQAALAAKIERGTISFSLGNILEFLLTVAIAYLLSRFLRFALQEDLYPRINLAPGLSYAVSSLLNYIILALGFIAALGVLGVDFSKVTVLAGAFGVGIGFGLQSIVNNFVSGLILLFERPIHVGDAVQIGDLQGRVRRIGIRASVLRTLQGAEIIVPNAQLITEQVTNWTLSDQLRRVDLPVGVNYGATPKKLIELLESVARAHPKVLTDPAPRALFMSYGDSSINFELRAWTDYANSIQVNSDLTVAVYDAVYAAGMSFPYPQRDVHLLGDANEGSTTASGKADKKN